MWPCFSAAEFFLQKRWKDRRQTSRLENMFIALQSYLLYCIEMAKILIPQLAACCRFFIPVWSLQCWSGTKQNTIISFHGKNDKFSVDAIWVEIYESEVEIQQVRCYKVHCWKPLQIISLQVAFSTSITLFNVHTIEQSSKCSSAHMIFVIFAPHTRFLG